jgi:hypothetical protein
MSSDAHDDGPGERRTGIPRDLPDQEAAPGEEKASDEEAVDEAAGDEGHPDIAGAAPGPARSGTSGGDVDTGDREPPEPVEPTD